MAVSSAPGSNLPGTMTSAAWAVAGSLIAGAVLSIIIAAKAADAPMAAHAWLFAFAFLAGVMMLGQRHINATQGHAADDGTGYNDGVVKAGAIATLFWGVRYLANYAQLRYKPMIKTLIPPMPLVGYGVAVRLWMETAARLPQATIWDAAVQMGAVKLQQRR